MAYVNAISWFEIPSIDLLRAQTFYETILGLSLVTMDLQNIKMRIFPIENVGGVGGSIVDSGGFHKPSATDGPLVYLNANPDVQMVLDKVVSWPVSRAAARSTVPNPIRTIAASCSTKSANLEPPSIACRLPKIRKQPGGSKLKRPKRQKRRSKRLKRTIRTRPPS